MASTPGAYNYVVTVRADLPPRPRFFVFLSLVHPRSARVVRHPPEI